MPLQEDGPQRDAYLENLARGGVFGGLILKNICRRHDDAVFVYGEDGNGSQHVVWVHGDRALVPGNTPIDEETWREASSSSELMHATNTVLLSAFQSAQRFTNVEDSIQGMAINGDRVYGLEQGDWQLGVRVSYENRVRPLMKVIRSGDQQKLAKYQTFFASDFAHELTHRYFQEGNYFGVGVPMETQAYAVQLLYAPRDNIILDETLQVMLDIVQKAGGVSKAEGYDKAQYFALALFANRISRQNHDIADVYAKGLTNQTFIKAQSLLTDEDILYLRTTVLKDFLETSMDELTNEAVRLTE